MTGRKIGYAYLAVVAQDITAQIERLKSAGCENVFQDSGIKGPVFDRAGFKAMLAALQAGDMLMVCSFDRLSRQIEERSEVFEQLRSKGVEYAALDGSPDVEFVDQMLMIQENYERRLLPPEDAFFRRFVFRIGQSLTQWARQ